MTAVLRRQAFLPLSYEGLEYTSETFHYEDDGDTQGYLDGQFQWTRLSYVLRNNGLTFTVSDGSDAFISAIAL